MVKVAKPYKEGKTWSLRRRVFGQDLYESGHATGAAAKKAMDTLVLAFERAQRQRQALADLGLLEYGGGNGGRHAVT